VDLVHVLVLVAWIEGWEMPLREVVLRRAMLCSAVYGDCEEV
jgi:hypothetical protein